MAKPIQKYNQKWETPQCASTEHKSPETWLLTRCFPRHIFYPVPILVRRRCSGRDSQRYCGVHHVSWYNMGVCFFYLNHLDEVGVRVRSRVGREISIAPPLIVAYKAACAFINFRFSDHQTPVSKHPFLDCAIFRRSTVFRRAWLCAQTTQTRSSGGRNSRT